MGFLTLKVCVLILLLVRVHSIEDPFRFTPFNFESRALNKKENPVCIIGAGISGLHLGNALQAKGYRVEIFEAKERVGGKAETFRDRDSVIIEKGPVYFSGANDSRLMALINKFHLTPIVLNTTLSNVQVFDSENGSIQPIPSLSEDVRARIAEASRNYLQYQQSFAKEMEPVNGYGALEDIPALYVLKFVNPDTFAILVSGRSPAFTLKEGQDVLMNRMAETLNVHLTRKVTQVVRSNLTYQELYFEDKRTTVKCQKTVLAFPPLLQNLDKLIPELSPGEKEVLAKVKVHKYTSAGYHLPPLDHELLYEGIRHSDLSLAPVLSYPRGQGEVIALLKQTLGKLNNVYVGSSWIRGDYENEATYADMEKIRSQQDSFLKKISPISRTYFTEKSEYFPHVTTASLRDGFYQKLDKIQGCDGIYYATTLLTFETMNDALEMSEYIANKYFEDQNA